VPSPPSPLALAPRPRPHPHSSCLKPPLPTRCGLQALDLSANDLRDGGALVLAEMVQANSSLTGLSLAHNSINSRG